MVVLQLFQTFCMCHFGTALYVDYFFILDNATVYILCKRFVGYAKRVELSHIVLIHRHIIRCYFM